LVLAAAAVPVQVQLLQHLVQVQHLAQSLLLVAVVVDLLSLITLVLQAVPAAGVLFL
jgi:hypothetical protein